MHIIKLTYLQKILSVASGICAADLARKSQTTVSIVSVAMAT